VAVGSALFVLVPLEAGGTLDQITRVVQGLTVGIGFLGAGAILKMTEEQKIIGLTTAANLWVTTAVGMAVGIGLFWPAVIAVVLGWVVLLGLGLMEPWLRMKRKK
jgi:putative Mg2+ transporter-C (MgtC) family protein